MLTLFSGLSVGVSDRFVILIILKTPDSVTENSAQRARFSLFCFCFTYQETDLPILYIFNMPLDL